MDLKGNNYKERSNNQLEEWVKGNPIHNKVDNECCPDFSCCKPDFMQPKEIRETFSAVCKKADEEGYNEECHPHYDTKMGMLMGFLGSSFSDELSSKKVHITDGNMSHKKDLN